MYNKWIGLSLGITTFLSGLYGGTGFFTAMGGNPAIAKLNNEAFAEYWQHIDGYMAARMPFFGPLLLLSTLVSVVLLVREWQSFSFWLMLSAFSVLVADMIFVFSVNHPLNRLIQGWDLHRLPSNVQEIKMQVVNAFNIRFLFMMSAFTLVVLAVWLRRAEK